jgi:hypothetical protein
LTEFLLVLLKSLYQGLILFILADFEVPIFIPCLVVFAVHREVLVGEIYDGGKPNFIFDIVAPFGFEFKRLGDDLVLLVDDLLEICLETVNALCNFLKNILIILLNHL